MKHLAKVKEQLVKKEESHEDSISLKPSEENGSQRGSDQPCLGFDSSCKMRTENGLQDLAKQDVPPSFLSHSNLLSSSLTVSSPAHPVIPVSFTGY